MPEMTCYQSTRYVYLASNQLRQLSFRLHYKGGFETFTSSMNTLWKWLILTITAGCWCCCHHAKSLREFTQFIWWMYNNASGQPTWVILRKKCAQFNFCSDANSHPLPAYKPAAVQQGQRSLSSSRSSKLHQLVAPSGELRGKGRCGVLAGKTVWSTPERLRGEVLTTRRYTNRRLTLLLPETPVTSSDLIR